MVNSVCRGAEFVRAGLGKRTPGGRFEMLGMTVRLKRGSVILAVALVLAGCVHSSPMGLDSNVEISKLNELPVPDAAGMQSGRREYFVGPGDKLTVDVFGVTELSRSVVTDAQGNFSFPLIGLVRSAGRTSNDIAAEIENRLRGQYILQPQVSVSVAEAASQMVTVGGQVKSPGEFSAGSSRSLMRAVALAGGPDQFAKLDEVLVFRTVGTKRYIGVYSLSAIQRGNYEDPDIYPDDVIMVGDSAARRNLDTLLKILPIGLAVAVLVQNFVR